MSKALEELGSLYKTICTASEQYSENDGVSIRELRTVYGIQKKDLRVFIQYLYTVYKLDEENKMFSFSILDENGNDIEFEGKKADADFDKAVVDNIMEKLNDDCKIYIFDRLEIFHEKIDTTMLKTGNISLSENIDQKSESMLRPLSDYQSEDIVYIDKNGRYYKILENKKLWIQAILQNKRIDFKIYYDEETLVSEKNVVAEGLYYDAFLQVYFGVYKNSTGQLKKVDLKNVAEISLIKEDNSESYEDEKPVQKEFPDAFDIEEYRNSQQTEKMQIRVYNEGKVKNKLKRLLENNQLTITEKDGYDLFEIYVEDEFVYAESFRKYGRSVIIEYPEHVKKNMKDDIDEVLEFYKRA